MQYNVTYICENVCKYMYPNMNKFIVSCMCEYIYIYIYICVCMYVYIDTHIYTHTYIYTHIYIYIYICVCVCTYVTICYYCVGNEERGDEGDSETIFINPHWETQGTRSHTDRTGTFRHITADKGS